MNKTKESKANKIKKYIAMLLVSMAQWIYPDSKEVKEFYMGLFHDQMIYGKSITLVDPKAL